MLRGGTEHGLASLPHLTWHRRCLSHGLCRDLEGFNIGSSLARHPAPAHLYAGKTLDLTGEAFRDVWGEICCEHLTRPIRKRALVTAATAERNDLPDNLLGASVTVHCS